MGKKEINKVMKSLDLNQEFFKNAKKLQIRAKIIICVLIGMILLFLYSMKMTITSEEVLKSWIMLGLSGLSIVIAAFLNESTHKKYANYVKSNVAVKMFEKEFDTFYFQPDNGFGYDYICSTKMYPKGNKYLSNDLLTGTYKKIGFTQADVLIQEETTNGNGGSKTITYFKGRWLIYDFNKEFKGTLQIRSNHLKTFSKKRKKNKRPKSFLDDSDLKVIEFDNPDFNELFTSYTNNKHDAFYIMTPHMMENMMKLNQELGCEIVIAFIDNKLHIAIYNDEDAFEVGVGNVNMKYINSVQKDIDLIKWVVDGLELTKDIYKS